MQDNFGVSGVFEDYGKYLAKESEVKEEIRAGVKDIEQAWWDQRCGKHSWSNRPKVCKSEGASQGVGQ